MQIYHWVIWNECMVNMLYQKCEVQVLKHQRMPVPQLVYSFTFWGTLLFPPITIHSKWAHGECLFTSVCVDTCLHLHFSCVYPDRTAESHGGFNILLSILRNCQTVFPKGCVISHPRQQWERASPPTSKACIKTHMYDLL